MPAGLRLSLCISTYNWPAALDLVLASVARQTVLPREVIVTDDGSGPDTAALIARWRARFPVPLVHVWQADTGFRLARARNLAVLAATGDYLVFLDGDMVLHPCFVGDHKRAAARGAYVQDVRAKAGKGLTRRLLEHQLLWPGFFAADIRGRRHLLHSHLLSHYRRQATRSLQNVTGSNMAFWKEDLLRVNGFNEAMEGWGMEDKELVIRLRNSGCRVRLLKYAGIAMHLYHPSRRAPEESNPNRFHLDKAKAGATWCEFGLDRHTGEDFRVADGAERGARASANTRQEAATCC
ncbi:glycosyltransferase [Parasulfuritortus cantonensis]|uniref:Glycosyltransferase n=1 Tax=Parasulfuritortus cantonensis TaxID=2528202 RepID=A0A4R1B2S1_9PROT|nr:glycosyltransferase family 2 protein [Parasulfuritortus cantonensis]TCJ11750.1 glycosyltransferase [Parasulfuritortus cantonensis]